MIVTKKSKNGLVDQDIIPMIKEMLVTAEDSTTVKLDCLICCQNPTLNPMQLISAIERYLPQLKPDHVRYCRNEIYTINERIFR